jgi:crossover junction endodeoxyribonuclease RuvC
MNSQIKRVLGIDPGTGRTGWAVVEGNNARQALIACGCFETTTNSKQAHRLEKIYEKIQELVVEYAVVEAAVEDLFFATNAKTAIRVGEARGVVVVAITQKKVPVYDYTPLQVKSTVTGYGNADKKQVQMMVKSILKLESVPKPDDAADAVAVALTHLFTNKALT